MRLPSQQQQQPLSSSDPAYLATAGGGGGGGFGTHPHSRADRSFAVERHNSGGDGYDPTLLIGSSSLPVRGGIWTGGAALLESDSSPAATGGRVQEPARYLGAFVDDEKKGEIRGTFSSESSDGGEPSPAHSLPPVPRSSRNNPTGSRVRGLPPPALYSREFVAPTLPRTAFVPKPPDLAGRSTAHSIHSAQRWEGRRQDADRSFCHQVDGLGGASRIGRPGPFRRSREELSGSNRCQQHDERSGDDGGGDTLGTLETQSRGRASYSRSAQGHRPSEGGAQPPSSWHPGTFSCDWTPPPSRVRRVPSLTRLDRPDRRYTDLEGFRSRAPAEVLPVTFYEDTSARQLTAAAAASRSGVGDGFGGHQAGGRQVPEVRGQPSRTVGAPVSKIHAPPPSSTRPRPALTDNDSTAEERDRASRRAEASTANGSSICEVQESSPTQSTSTAGTLAALNAAAAAATTTTMAESQPLESSRTTAAFRLESDLRRWAEYEQEHAARHFTGTASAKDAADVQRAIDAEQGRLEEVAQLESDLQKMSRTVLLLLALLTIFWLLSSITAYFTPAWWFGVGMLGLCFLVPIAGYSYRILSESILRGQLMLLPLVTLMTITTILGCLAEHVEEIDRFMIASFAGSLCAVATYGIFTWYAAVACGMIARRHEILFLHQLLKHPQALSQLAESASKKTREAAATITHANISLPLNLKKVKAEGKQKRLSDQDLLV